MLLCNLAVLMAERGLKIADVYEQTGISKTTLMALSENKGKGVQFETVDKLCNFFQINPSDFFVYSSYIFTLKKIAENNTTAISITGKQGIKKVEFEPFTIFKDDDFVHIHSEDEELENIFNEMNKLLQRKFISDLRKAIFDIYKINSGYEITIFNTLIDKK